MNDKLNMLFVDNLGLKEEIEAFCAKDPEYLEVKREFYEVAHEIAKMAGFELYNRFETRLGSYLGCSNDLYYLFGLGLRQDIISALQPKVS